MSGRLAPGTRLDEQEIANRFGVSRTPVREAVRHLVATGLADSQPHQGATVAGFSTERLAAFQGAVFMKGSRRWQLEKALVPVGVKT